jgi:hypothetical protein
MEKQKNNNKDYKEKLFDGKQRNNNKDYKEKPLIEIESKWSNNKARKA